MEYCLLFLLFFSATALLSFTCEVLPSLGAVSPVVARHGVSWSLIGTGSNGDRLLELKGHCAEIKQPSDVQD